MDTTELKKKLAKLKKEYKSKEIVLKKVERRAHSKAHVKRRVEEEAKKTAESKCLINVRKPVKVKFEEEITRTPSRCGQSDNEDTSKCAREGDQSTVLDENGRNNSCQVVSHSLSIALSNEITQDESQVQLLESQDVDVKGKLESETGSSFKKETDDIVKGDCNNQEFNANVCPDDQYSKKAKSVEAENASNTSVQESELSEKRDSPASARAVQRAKNRESMIDYSFLDEESDLYSQIKSRKRRSRESPSLGDNLSQLSAQPKKKVRTPQTRTPKSSLCHESSQQEPVSSKLKVTPSIKPVSVKEIFDKISSSSDLTSQEDFNLPEEFTTDVKHINSVPSTCLADSEKTSPRPCHSLPANIKPCEKVSPLCMPALAFSSQVDFKSQKSSLRKGKVTRKIKPYRQKKSSTPKTLSKDPRTDAKDAYPFQSCGMIKTKEPVLQVECCGGSILICTSSAVTLWSNCEGGWTTEFLFPADAGEVLEGCKMMVSGLYRAVVIVSRSMVSFLYRLVQLQGQEATVLHEVPFTQSSQIAQFSNRKLLCCVSPTDLLVAVPSTEHYLHTDLVHVMLTNNLKEVTVRRKLPIVSSKLVSLCRLRKVGGKFAVGTSAESVFIWNLDGCLLLKEVSSQYKIKHCAGAVAEQGIVFMACIVDDGESGGLFAVNPATGRISLVTKLESEVLWKNKNKRWHSLVWHDRFMCVSATNCTAVFSAYRGHLVSHTAGMGRLSCMDIAQDHAAFASKSSVLLFNISKPLHAPQSS